MLEFWTKVFVYAFEAYALLGVVFAALFVSIRHSGEYAC